jgi:hypothetical protein
VKFLGLFWLKVKWKGLEFGPNSNAAAAFCKVLTVIVAGFLFDLSCRPTILGRLTGGLGAVSPTFRPPKINYFFTLNIHQTNHFKRIRVEGKVLIANRGEIAIRIMNACRDLDLDYIVVYTDADKDSEHVVRNSVEGPDKNAWRITSYTEPNDIFAVADHTGCTAIHPGTGFSQRTSVLPDGPPPENGHFSLSDQIGK